MTQPKLLANNWTLAQSICRTRNRRSQRVLLRRRFSRFDILVQGIITRVLHLGLWVQ